MKKMIKKSFFVMISVGFAVCAWLGISYNPLVCATAQHNRKGVSVSATMTQDIYQFTLPLDTGADLPLAELKGKVILFVNTAAKCNFASQYKALEELYQKYKDQGFVIIGVSSDDFHQEITDEEERTCFLDSNFPTTFPLTQTLKVTGKKAHPLYQWLNKKAGWFGSVKWNFHKFLVGKDGQFIDWFAPTTKPNAKKVIKAIEKALAAE